MFYVYKITNLVNEKVYIGKSINGYDRWHNHCILANHPDDVKHHLIHKAIAKYKPDNFNFEIIDTFDLEQDALNQEKCWIAFYQTNVYEYGSEYGYNLTAGGEGISGFKHSDETKEKLSKATSSFFKTNPHPLKGKKMSDETKRKMSKAKKGKPARNKGIPMSAAQKQKQSEASIKSGWALGSKNPSALINETQARQIKKLLSEKIPVRDIMKLIGTTENVVRNIKKGVTWKRVQI